MSLYLFHLDETGSFGVGLIRDERAALEGGVDVRSRLRGG
jgi:hypothetical protein